MDPLQKLAWVNAEARFEADGEPLPPNEISEAAACSASTPKQFQEHNRAKTLEAGVPAKGQNIPIFVAAGGGGRRVPLLKAMLTTACERNCNYCAFRAHRNYRRVTFKPDELAKTFFNAYRAGWVEGLFLSTGVFAGGVHTQDKLLDTASILRMKYGYRGYLHLKIMPGAEFEQVRQAMRLANRISANLEAPNQGRLTYLAPQKKFEQELLQSLRWAQEIRSSENADPSPWSKDWASTTTQFVVGPAGESDLELLSIVANLYSNFRIRRAYFEAFNPILDTPFEGLAPEKPLRQHRLYQASYLLRDYGFDLEELPFHENGQLPEDRDPKQAYADRYYQENPLELNQAGREHLLRIPGIGHHSASAIIQARRLQRLKDMGQLRRLGIIAERSAPYILLDGKRPSYQTLLFSL
jgi:predicted DNA-binding helix-hairpin-helix protein